MAKLFAAALAVMLVLGGTGYAEAKKNHTGRNIAIGVGAALATGIILNEAARAEGRSSVRRYDSEDGHDRTCRRWRRLCNDEGERWACRKYDNNC
ncbi:MAG: hypothetical protein ABL908_16875 [Hyphomicrobium sp.]